MELNPAEQNKFIEVPPVPTSVSFWDANPQRSFRPALVTALRTATSLDVAVAFITRAGVDFFRGQVRQFGAGRCRLTVSVQFPTDLDALCRLSSDLGDWLHIHLGSDTPHEVSGKPFSPLMHSKVVWMDTAAGDVTVFVGSHNWTSTALDGVNMEAGVRIECPAGEQAALDAKAHLDACFAASVRFDPAELEFYRAIQHSLYPRRPANSQREAITEFDRVPNAPAVVIHAEDHRTAPTPHLLLYLPLSTISFHDWFDPIGPTQVFLYLYPRGTLLGHSTPAEDPSFFEGVVTTFSRVGNPITGQRVDAQIADLDRPVLTTVPSGNIPTPAGGISAQVVAELRHRGSFSLPVYSQDTDRPGVRVEARFEEAGDEEVRMPEAAPEPLPAGIAGYYAPGSVSSGHFVFHHPHPTRSTTIQVPGGGFYRVAPDQTIREYLIRRYEGIQVEVTADQLPPPYLYRVWFVFRPPHGTHTGSGRQPSLFD